MWEEFLKTGTKVGKSEKNDVFFLVVRGHDDMNLDVFPGGFWMITASESDVAVGGEDTLLSTGGPTFPKAVG